jgi:hypothetical protein
MGGSDHAMNLCSGDFKVINDDEWHHTCVNLHDAIESAQRDFEEKYSTATADERKDLVDTQTILGNQHRLWDIVLRADHGQVKF